MKNPLVYFEIYADDTKTLANFYTNLFDWKVEPAQGMTDYLTVKTVELDAKGTPTQGGGINGGIMKKPDRSVPSIVNYVSVESVDQSVERAQKLGAKVMKAKSPVPGMGWFSILSDPQGNPFAVWQTDSAAK